MTADRDRGRRDGRARGAGARGRRALRAEGAEVAFVGGERAEAELVPRRATRSSGSGRGDLADQPAQGGARGAKAVAAIGAGLRILAPYADAVLGGGGYVAGPVGLAAVLCARRCPLPRPTSTWASRTACSRRGPRRVCLAFPLAGRDGKLPRHRPARAADVADRAAARAALGLAAEDRVLLVFGGSLGARSINEAAVEAFADAPYRVLHVAGARDFAALRAPGPHYDLREYLTPFGQALARRGPGRRPRRRLVFELAAVRPARRCSCPTRTPPPTTRPQRPLDGGRRRRGRPARRRADAGAPARGGRRDPARSRAPRR